MSDQGKPQGRRRSIAHKVAVKRQLDATRGKTRINIGSAFERWRKVMQLHHLRTDEMMAEFLLERRYEGESKGKKTTAEEANTASALPPVQMGYQTGFCNKGILEQMAVPTLKETTSPQLTREVRKVAAGTQTIDSETKAVGTQLSASRLKSPVRSKASQTEPSERLASRRVRKAFQLVYMPAGGSAPAETPSDRREAGSDTELRDEDFVETETMRTKSNKGGLKPPAALERSTRELFKTCPACLSDCKVRRETSGTLSSFSQLCRICPYSRTWHCQRPAGSIAAAETLLRSAEGVSSFKLVKEKTRDDNNAETERFPGLYRHSDLPAVRSETSIVEKPTPQHIVSEDALLQLTKSCPVCRRLCRRTKHTQGPYLLIYQMCCFCNYQRKWASQPEAQMLTPSSTKKTTTVSKKKCHPKVVEATTH